MRLDLSIFDQAFVLESTVEQAESLKALAKKLDLQLRTAKASSPRLTPERITILSALGLLQDNERLQQELSLLKQQPIEDVASAIKRLEQLTQQAQTLIEQNPISQSDSLALGDSSLAEQNSAADNTLEDDSLASIIAATKNR